MTFRQTILELGYYYHIYNRGINSQLIFESNKDYQQALDLINYYNHSIKKVRFSQLKRLPEILKTKQLNELKSDIKLLVDIVAYCFMPTHFHFLLKQNQDNSISKFMSDFQNSYTRYFNTKHNRFGPILQGTFKSVYIENDYYLNHLSRYIHLNPYSSGLVKNSQDLESYPWSSFPEYLGKTTYVYCKKDIVLNQFKDINDYREFVFNQKDFQLELQLLKDHIIESE